MDIHASFPKASSLSLPTPGATVTTVDRTGHSALAPKVNANWGLWGQVPTPRPAAPCRSTGLDAGVGAHSPQL